MNRRAINWCFGILLVFVLLIPARASAQSATIGVYDQFGPACNTNIGAGQFVLLFARIDGALGPIKTAKFKVLPTKPITDFPAAGLDFDLTMTPCAETGAFIASFVVYNTGSTIIGINFNIVPHTGETEILLTDCDDYSMTGRDTFGWAEPCDNMSSLLAPYRPIPANGATNVPINTTLSFFSGDASEVALSTTPFQQMNAPMICSNNPYHPTPAPFCTLPIDPGMLQPNTTYYWQASVVCWGCYHGEGAISRVFSFTTAGPTAVESKTWGAIKALYRE